MLEITPSYLKISSNNLGTMLGREIKLIIKKKNGTYRRGIEGRLTE